MPSLNIKLRYAKNLTPKDIGGTSDPIVICNVNNKKSFKTDPIMMDCNPNWENKKVKREFVCNFDKMTDVITLLVEDYNIFSKNKPIGSCQVPIQFLEKSKPMEFTFDLRDNKAAISGQLTVILEAIDFGLVYSQPPPTTTTMPVYPPSQPSSYFPPQTQPYQQQPPSANLQRNGSSPTLSTLRHGSFLSNNNIVQTGQLVNSQSFIMPSTESQSMMGSSYMPPGSSANVNIQYGGMQPSQQQPLTHSNSFINYSHQQQPGNLSQTNSFINYPQPTQPIQQQQSIQPNISQMGYPNQYVQNSSNISSTNQQLMTSSSNNLMDTQLQSSQQQHSTDISSTPRKALPKALPTLPTKQQPTSPQSFEQQNIPKSTQSNPQWTGVVTDQYIDYVVSLLPIPLSIPEYYERFVRPFKI